LEGAGGDQVAKAGHLAKEHGTPRWAATPPPESHARGAPPAAISHRAKLTGVRVPALAATRRLAITITIVHSRKSTLVLISLRTELGLGEGWRSAVAAGAALTDSFIDSVLMVLYSLILVIGSVDAAAPLAITAHCVHPS
jgi:hypothetical protein